MPGCEFVKKTSGLQKLAYDQFMSSHFNLDFMSYLKARLRDMFVQYVLDWDNIHFESSIAALKTFNTGNVYANRENVVEQMDHLQQDQRCPQCLPMSFWLAWS